MYMRVAASSLVLGAVVLGGCATRAVDLVSTGRIALDQGSAAALERAPVVEEVGGDLVVRGWLSEAEVGVGDHVRVTVRGLDGAVVREAIARCGALRSSRSTMRGPRGAGKRVGTGPEFAAFSVRLEGLPPAGSRVQVRVQPNPGLTDDRAER